MNEVDLFLSLAKHEKSELLELLENSYFEMNTEQRQVVFGHHISNEINNMKIEKSDAEDILCEIKYFYKESLAGAYYSPFDINSKNFMNTPEETDEWCSEYGIFLDKSSHLTKQNFHEEAIQCFQMLFDLMDKLGDDDIIFGDEVGSWMVGGDTKQATTCYILSASKIVSTQKFVEHLVPLLKSDSYVSFYNEVYKSSVALATKEQVFALQTEIERQKIRIPT